MWRISGFRRVPLSEKYWMRWLLHIRANWHFHILETSTISSCCLIFSNMETKPVAEPLVIYLWLRLPSWWTDYILYRFNIIGSDFTHAWCHQYFLSKSGQNTLCILKYAIMIYIDSTSTKYISTKAQIIDRISTVYLITRKFFPLLNYLCWLMFTVSFA